jgi:hypothetical protein
MEYWNSSQGGTGWPASSLRLRRRPTSTPQ